jgi:fructuronate reductase
MAERLSRKTLAAVPSAVQRPRHDFDAVSTGIVHFGPGAFFRAHIASYIDDLLARDPHWGIAAVALRRGALADDLAAQDNLYTLAVLGAPPRYRILGALQDYLTGAANGSKIRAMFERPAIKLITMTVTEKGYCLGTDGRLDPSHPDIVHDLTRPPSPRSVAGWIVEALAIRRAINGRAPIVMSCDNVASNGEKLRASVIDLAQAQGRAELARWIAGEVRFPSTMVDSIAPMPDDALRSRASAALGLSDAIPVQREPFRQWVVSDNLGPDAPDLASVGVVLTDDVHAFEQAKLRLLNGAHSALAYIGLLRGHATVDEAMRDAPLAAFVERLMREDSAATLAPVAGLDIPSYITTILERLRNPAIAHRLTQIAADGSQKLPYRWLGPITDLLCAGRPVSRAVVPVAAWMRFACRARLDDPLADKVAAVTSACTGVAANDVPRFLALGEMFPRELAGNSAFSTALVRAYEDLGAAKLPV